LKQLIKIELFGQQYTFGTEADISTAKAVADLLIREVAEVEAQLSINSATVTKQTILVLAALNIASEHHKLKEKYAELLKNMSEQSANLIRRLDG